MTVTPENILVSEGMTVTLYCNITGFPINNVVWKKNFQSLATSTRMTLLSQEVLKISSVQREDSGMYQCFVYGGDSTSAQGAARLALKGKKMAVCPRSLVASCFEFRDGRNH